MNKNRTLFLAATLCVGIFCGCPAQDTSQNYVVVHNDGRVWLLEAEPYEGGKHGLSGWGSHMIVWQGEYGVCLVLPENCVVLPSRGFRYDPSRHRMTTEMVRERW